MTEEAAEAEAEEMAEEEAEETAVEEAEVTEVAPEAEEAQEVVMDNELLVHP